MARDLKGIVAAYIALLVHSTGVLGELLSENEILTSWKGVNELSLNSYSDPNVTSDCAEYSICNNVDNYPTELAKWALEELQTKFNAVRYTVEKMHVETKGEIYQICRSQEEIMYPTAALGKNGWYFILNLPNRNFQGYYINKCGNNSNGCLGAQSSTSSCKQGYTERRMIYLDLKKQIVSMETFKVPSCCSCAVYF